MSEKINKNFKGLYDTSKTTFITDRTEPTHFYEPEVKTPNYWTILKFYDDDLNHVYNDDYTIIEVLRPHYERIYDRDKVKTKNK